MKCPYPKPSSAWSVEVVVKPEDSSRLFSEFCRVPCRLKSIHVTSKNAVLRLFARKASAVKFKVSFVPRRSCRALPLLPACARARHRRLQLMLYQEAIVALPTSFINSFILIIVLSCPVLSQQKTGFRDETGLSCQQLENSRIRLHICRTENHQPGRRRWSLWYRIAVDKQQSRSFCRADLALRRALLISKWTVTTIRKAFF